MNHNNDPSKFPEERLTLIIKLFIIISFNPVFRGFMSSLTASRSSGSQQPDQPLILPELKSVITAKLFNPSSAFTGKLQQMTALDLKELLNQFFIELLENDQITDPAVLLDRLASLISLDKLQEASDIKDALEEAKMLFEEAKVYLQMTEPATSPNIRALLLSILEGVASVIDSIVLAFGIGEFFKPAESDIQADFKSQKIMMLLSLFSMITTAILPALGAETGGRIIGGILIAIAALSAIWPLIKPMTTFLPANAENWTKQIRNGGFVAQGRKESLDEIATIFKTKRHAILVGPSRVGKSLTAKAFASAVERGDYPELKGKVIFRINTTDLLDQKASFLGGGNNILNKISAAMGRHRNDIILVFDEIHMACKNDQPIADTFKTFLDEHGEFPYVIGITTEEEYDAHVKDHTAFSNRLTRVDIKNTSQDETLQILAQTILTSPSLPLIQEDVLELIYTTTSQTEGAPQPSTSLKLLRRCINKTQKTQKSATELKIMEVSAKILSLRSQAAASHSRKKESRVITTLESELKALQALLPEEKKKFDKLYQSKDLLDKITKETYSTIIKISSIAQRTFDSTTEKELKRFLLLHKFLSQALESHIEASAKPLGVHAVINQELIEQVAASA